MTINSISVVILLVLMGMSPCAFLFLLLWAIRRRSLMSEVKYTTKELIEVIDKMIKDRR